MSKGAFVRVPLCRPSLASHCRLIASPSSLSAVLFEKEKMLNSGRETCMDTAHSCSLLTAMVTDVIF